jgi:2-C-methyl-D-erythritol 4-phosphate cytidylyltransferase
VIAAAGSGERLGAGGPKALVEVAGRPLLIWSLAAFDAAESIAEIVVAAPPGSEGRIETLAGEHGIQVRAAPGGEHRSRSVANALVQVDSRYVVVHDAARPLVAPGLIDAVVARLDGDSKVAGVVAATPVTDTIKEASASRRVVRTPDRDRLWAVQTPQAFRTDALRSALSEHADDLASASDDSMLVERAGGEVLLHEAPAENIKVTTQLDLTVAGLLLAQRAAGTPPA